MLIFLEGLPGAGKSTNSGLLYRQLEWSGKSARWIHELLRPHPVLFFNEACLSKQEFSLWCEKYDKGKVMDKLAQQREVSVGIDLLEVEWHYRDYFSDNALHTLNEKDVWNFPLSSYIKVALEKWRSFAKEAAKHPEKVYILDSCIFQYQIFCFQLENAPKQELIAFIRELWEIVRDLNPHLVYLYREAVEDQMEHIREVRGQEFFQSIWERDRHTPYYSDKPNNVDAYYRFLRDYDQIVRELFEDARCPKLAIEVTDGKWEQYESSLLQFFRMERFPAPDFAPPSGQYRNKELNLSLKILADSENGYKLIDPNGRTRRLYARTSTEWYIQDFPVTLIADHQNQVKIGGDNLTDRWTESGLVFERF